MDRQTHRFLKRGRELPARKTRQVREIIDGPVDGKILLHSAEKFAEFGLGENANAFGSRQAAGRDEKARHNQAQRPVSPFRSAEVVRFETSDQLGDQRLPNGSV